MAFVLALLIVMLHLLSPGEIFPALAPYHILMILLLLAGLLSIPALLQSFAITRLRKQMFLLLAFFAWVSVSWIFHGWLGGIVATLENLAPSLIVYFLAIVEFHKPFRLRILHLALLVVAFFILGKAVSELPQARATKAQTPYVMVEDPEAAAPAVVRIRGLGMLHDPNYYGQFLLILLPLLFVSNSPTRGMSIGYIFAIPAALLLIAGIYLTNSRGSQLGLLLLVGFALWKKYRRIGIFLSIVIAPLAVVVINATRSRTISISGGVDRLMLWSEGLGMFKSSPLWGIGYYQFTERERLTAHNTYLLCASEMGIIGFLIWMSLVVVTIMLLRRVPAVVGASDPVVARWAQAILLSLYAYLFTSFFLSRLYDLPLYLLIGMAGGVINSAGGEETISLRGTHWPAWAGGTCVALLVLIYVLVRLRIVA